MLLAALFVGLCLGFSLYHWWAMPYVAQRAYDQGLDKADRRLKKFLEGMPEADRARFNSLAVGHIEAWVKALGGQ